MPCVVVVVLSVLGKTLTEAMLSSLRDTFMYPPSENDDNGPEDGEESIVGDEAHDSEGMCSKASS